MNGWGLTMNYKASHFSTPGWTKHLFREETFPTSGKRYTVSACGFMPERSPLAADSPVQGGVRTCKRCEKRTA